jgi:predicted NAD/FAD-dependent oxidoreductase
MKVAVIGAGIAGVSFAKTLTASTNCRIELFEKSRGLGGRMSVRHAGEHSFDHGAQFFTARTREFNEVLRQYSLDGVVREWDPQIVTLSPRRKSFKRIWYEPHYVSSPSMNKFCKLLAQDLTVTLDTQVDQVEKLNGSWWLQSADESFGPFDWVVSTAPPEQTRKLFPGAVGAEMDGVRFDPCFALMLSCSGALPTWDAAVVRHSPISWLAFTDRKPGRHFQPSLVAHADGAWSQEHLYTDAEQITAQLLEAISAVAAIQHDQVVLHRWRYARVTVPLGQDFWVDEISRLAACGDWCLGNRVEDAFVSASRLAQRLANV